MVLVKIGIHMNSLGFHHQNVDLEVSSHALSCFFVQGLHVTQRSWDEEIYATATCRNINMLRSLYQIKSWTESHVNDLTGASTHSMVDLQSTGRLTL